MKLQGVALTTVCIFLSCCKKDNQTQNSKPKIKNAKPKVNFAPIDEKNWGGVPIGGVRVHVTDGLVTRVAVCIKEDEQLLLRGFQAKYGTEYLADNLRWQGDDTIVYFVKSELRVHESGASYTNITRGSEVWISKILSTGVSQLSKKSEREPKKTRDRRKLPLSAKSSDRERIRPSHAVASD